MAQQNNLAEPYQRVDVAGAKQLIAKGDIQVIDVRTPTEYSGGHIPQARSVPLDSILANPRGVLKADNILFVCQVGQRSALAAEMAAAVGFETVFNLEGGTDAWIKAGEAVAR